MKSIGFVISKKENEKRRALILNDIDAIKNRDYVYFEEGYGEILGYTDQDIIDKGCHVVPLSEIYKCDIICDPKIGDSEYLTEIKDKTVFGWIHATQNVEITDCFINNNLTGYAWEKMFDTQRHIFNGNNIIAGEAAVIHAMTVFGKVIEDCDVAVLGNGNTSKGAQKILNKFNNRIKIYTSKSEEKFKKEMEKFDVIVNSILWNVNRKDHIIYEEDLKRLKKGALIIDISCDHNGGIESSIPTTIENPMYIKNGVSHYVVDHTPSILYKDASISISKEVVNYVDDLIEENNNEVLDNALIIKSGKIVDNEIIEYQNR